MKPKQLSAILIIPVILFSCRKHSDDNSFQNGFFNQMKGGSYANDMTTDATDNIYVAGFTKIAQAGYQLDFNGAQLASKGNGDAFIIKYDTNGQTAWAKVAGGTSDEQVYAVGVDNAQNVYVAGNFRDSTNLDGTVLKLKYGSAYSYDAFFVKYNSNGSQQWVKQISGTGNEGPAAIAVDNANGKIYVTGTFYGNIYFDNVAYTANNAAFFLASYNPDGQLNWVKTYGGDILGGSVYATKMNITSDGGIVIAGSYEGARDIAGTSMPYYGNQDMFVAKFTNTGNAQWVKPFGSAGQDICSTLSIDKAIIFTWEAHLEIA